MIEVGKAQEAGRKVSNSALEALGRLVLKQSTELEPNEARQLKIWELAAQSEDGSWHATELGTQVWIAQPPTDWNGILGPKRE